MRTASVSWPPDSKPKYPGGAPIILLTECFSIYSDISSLVIEEFESNIILAVTLLSSVFPTPVGPKKRKLANGLLGSFRPVLDLLMESATALIALSWPIIFSLRIDSRLKSLSFSDWFKFCTGIEVHFETTSAISSKVTSCLKRLVSPFFWEFTRDSLFSFNFFCKEFKVPNSNSAALLRSKLLLAWSICNWTDSISSFMVLISSISSFSFFHWAPNSACLSLRDISSLLIFFNLSIEKSSVSLFKDNFSISNCRTFRSISSISSGLEVMTIFNLEAASSIRSIALSGRNLSLIYLSLRVAAATKALSEILTLWWTSYLSLNPLKIDTVSSIEGASTFIFWNLRSKAGSFSIFCLCSLIVVAPIHLSSPLASIGFNRLLASKEPPLAPAPTTVWISSIKRIILPSDSFTFFRIFFILSSNSPRYFAPAKSEPISNEISFLSCSAEGTSPLIILWANPSTMAVFPTPGSPIRTGLFFVLLLNIWIVLLISSSLPITGSKIPSRADWVRSILYFSKDSLELLNSFFTAGSDFIFFIISRNSGIPFWFKIWNPYLSS